MADNTTDYLSAVNDVIAVCKDAEEGFNGAANAVNDPALKSSFNNILLNAPHSPPNYPAWSRLGLTPKNSSGVLGTIHHGWIALKGTLTSHSEHQIWKKRSPAKIFL